MICRGQEVKQSMQRMQRPASMCRRSSIAPIRQRLLQSRSRAELVAAARALDRVLRHGWYLVPHFYAATHRVAYRDVLAHPSTMPKYYAAPPWLLKTWWLKPGAEGR